jgi:hypothetical protein
MGKAVVMAVSDSVISAAAHAFGTLQPLFIPREADAGNQGDLERTEYIIQIGPQATETTRTAVQLVLAIPISTPA